MAVGLGAVGLPDFEAHVQKSVVVVQIGREEQVGALLEQAMRAVDGGELVGIASDRLFQRAGSIERLRCVGEAPPRHASVTDDVPCALEHRRSLDPEALVDCACFGVRLRCLPVGASESIEGGGLLEAERVDRSERRRVVARALEGEEILELARELLVCVGVLLSEADREAEALLANGPSLASGPSSVVAGGSFRS